jgi:hypothetical protein
LFYSAAFGAILTINVSTRYFANFYLNSATILIKIGSSDFKIHSNKINELYGQTTQAHKPPYIGPPMLLNFLRHLLAFAFLAWVLPYTACAQQPCYLHLKVVDKHTQEPLDELALRLDGTVLHIQTDSNGIILMPITCIEHLVQFQKLGYLPFSRRFTFSKNAQDAPIIIELENRKNQLEEVVVSSQGSQRTLETPALGVNLLSMKAVKKITPAAGEVDILRSLQSLPGVSSVGEGANGLNIRGGQVDQNLILLDNMPIYNPTHLLGLFSLFPTDAIREIQLYKGSIPARYGGKTAGVLDVRLSEPDMERTRFSGGIGLISNRLHLEKPIIKEKLSVLTSARLSYTDPLIRLFNKNFIGVLSDTRLPNAKPVFYDWANKIAWRPTARDHLALTAYWSYDRYGVNDLFTIAGITPRLATMAYGHRNYALRWNHYFSENLNLNTQLVRTDYATSTDAQELGADFVFKTRLLHHIAKSEVTFLPTEKHKIMAGVAINRYDNRAGQLVPGASANINAVELPKEQAWEAVAFAADEYALSARTLIEVGLRWTNYWNMGAYPQVRYAEDAPKSPSSVVDTLQIAAGASESYYGRLEPRLALRYKISERQAVKLGYNRTNQFLQMIANNTTPLPNVRWKTANRYIKPSQSDLVTAGYFHDTKDRSYEWSVEAYYRWQSNIFDYVNGASLDINPLIETQLLNGRARAYGLEVFANKKKGVVTGWVSYTYSRSTQQILGDFPQLQQINDGKWFRSNIDRPHSINAFMNIHNDKHHTASFTFTYSSGRPFTAPTAYFKQGTNILPVFTERNNRSIEPYHRLDFSWTIHTPRAKAKRFNTDWVVAFYNIYGRNNAFSYFFNTSLGTFIPYKISVFPSPIFSITWNISLK